MLHGALMDRGLEVSAAVDEEDAAVDRAHRGDQVVELGQHDVLGLGGQGEEQGQRPTKGGEGFILRAEQGSGGTTMQFSPPGKWR